MADFISLVASELTSAQAYDFLVASIQPRPIALVSTLSSRNEPNLAPFSFFMPGGVSPLSVAFSVTQPPSGKKDSLRNIEETGEFVINSVHREMAEGMNATSYGFPNGVPEWYSAGFTPIPSTTVKPARIEESLMHLECMLFQVVPHGAGPGAGSYVIGEIVAMHISSDYWVEGRIVAGGLPLIARMCGQTYLDTEVLTRFDLPRPTGPPGVLEGQ